MTLGDFLKRVDIDKDKNKMIILSDGIGWTNIELIINGQDIVILPDKRHSPFSSDNF